MILLLMVVVGFEGCTSSFDSLGSTRTERVDLITITSVITTRVWGAIYIEVIDKAPI